jgi:hypothetical protein
MNRPSSGFSLPTEVADANALVQAVSTAQDAATAANQPSSKDIAMAGSP